MKHLMAQDPDIARLVEAEAERQSESLTLIPSENHASPAVLETLVRDRAKALFGVPHANVQPYSGSPANLAVYLAAMNPGDTLLGLDLAHGGHLTHGHAQNATGRLWRGVAYHVNADGMIDLDDVRRLAKKEKPKLIVCGGTALPRAIPFKAFAEIADECGALLMADMSHIAGLVAGGAHESPVPYVHIVTTTTHKTLRGPRGAMILVTQKGLDTDNDLATKIDKAIIPGMQGGPHLNNIAGIGVALKEASQPGFKDYAARIVHNAKTLADALRESGFSLVSGGTDNHLILIDLSPSGIGRGVLFNDGLERIGLIANKNTVPQEQGSPLYPSGLRLGTPAVTTRGLDVAHIKQIASWISQFSEHVKTAQVPAEKTARASALAAFRSSFATDPFYDSLREEVRALAKRYPIPAAPTHAVD
jgi:glycine hydroxymethyltransferase